MRGIDEVDVRFVHEEHALELGRDRLDGFPVEEPSRRGVGVHEEGETGAAAVERRGEAVGHLPPVGKRQLDRASTVDPDEDLVQAVGRGCDRDRLSGIDVGGEGEAKQLVTPVGGDDFVRIDPMQARRRHPEGVGGGGRIAAQAFDGKPRDGPGDGRRRRVGVLVGIELHAARGLLSRHVAGDVAQTAALVGGRFHGALGWQIG